MRGGVWCERNMPFFIFLGTRRRAVFTQRRNHELKQMRQNYTHEKPERGSEKQNTHVNQNTPHTFNIMECHNAVYPHVCFGISFLQATYEKVYLNILALPGILSWSTWATRYILVFVVCICWVGVSTNNLNI